MSSDFQIRYAGSTDLPFLVQHDRLISEETMRRKVADRQVIACTQSTTHLGSARFGFGWDMFPFLHFIAVVEAARGRGIGRALMEFWEREMRAGGHKLLVTSTDVDEQAQHFYRKLGYRDSGGILFPRELFPESAMELILIKVLT